MVREREKALKGTLDPLNIAAVVLLILSPVPLILSAFFGGSDMAGAVGVCLLLLFAATGVALFVYTGTLGGGFARLLEEGSFTRAKKEEPQTLAHALSAVYWLVVTAIFLIYLFALVGRGVWVWLIWAVAGVLYGAVAALLRLTKKGRR
ncbi:MAG: hypothetical protein NC084_11325 [Bacteroides sp.]|nr:hypothetical protein [Bacteroides sp.]